MYLAATTHHFLIDETHFVRHTTVMSMYIYKSLTRSFGTPLFLKKQMHEYNKAMCDARIQAETRAEVNPHGDQDPVTQLPTQCWMFQINEMLCVTYFKFTTN